MRLFFFMLITSLIMGCSSIPFYSPSNNNLSNIRCDKVPKVWWGRRGDNPSKNNNLWKCYDWILKARK